MRFGRVWNILICIDTKPKQGMLVLNRQHHPQWIAFEALLALPSGKKMQKNTLPAGTHFIPLKAVKIALIAIPVMKHTGAWSFNHPVALSSTDPSKTITSSYRTKEGAEMEDLMRRPGVIEELKRLRSRP